MYFFLLYVCLCIFSEYVFTLYSKQINNYKLILLACECVFLWFIGNFVLFSWSGPNPDPTEPVGSKNWFSTSVCEWSVCVFYFSTTFLLGNWYRSTAVETIFLFVSSFSNKDWTFKTTTLLYCLLFSVIRVFLPFHKYIIVKKLETLISLTYMYDHKVAY